VIGCPNDQLFFKIMNVLGLQEHAKDPRFATWLQEGERTALLDAIEPAVALRQVGSSSRR
jgi:crotonobetainyl-CoA:carnitine CoA-transferase CaiB-like acyl-CoA transferase